MNCLHPGTIATNIWSGAPWFARPVLELAKRVVMEKSATGGSRLAHLATSPEVAGRSGGYYEKNRLKEPATLAKDAELGRRLVETSRRLVGLDAVAGT